MRDKQNKKFKQDQLQNIHVPRASTDYTELWIIDIKSTAPGQECQG